MANSFIQVPTDGAGKQVDTRTTDTDGDHRQVIVLGDQATDAALTEVLNTSPIAADYGLVVRNTPRREGQVISTSNLGISGVFTQAWQDANADGTTSVEAAARADQAAASDGFVIQQTDDDTDGNFTETVASKDVSASTTTFLHATITARKWRIQYTNGGTGQASFKITSSAATVPVFPIDPDGKGMGISAQFDDSATVLPDENELAALRITAQRGLHTNLRNNAGTEIGTTAAPVGVQLGDGTDTALVTAAGELNVISTAQAGVDIGDVTINNGAGGAAVNIQDGGNSITVDNAALSVVGGGAEATALRVTIADDSTGLLSIDDNAGSLTVDAPTGTPVNVQIGDGTDQALVTAAGELNVTQPASHTRNEVFAESLAIGGELDDAATTAATEGNVSPARITAQRAFHTNLRNVAGTEIGTTADPVGVQIGDGSDTALVTAAGELNVIATAQAGVDIGDVTINNAGAGAAVNIQDGGNSITVDAPTGTPVNVQIGDGTDQAAVTGANELSVLASAQPGVDIGDVTINNGGAGAAVNIQDGGNSLTVDAPVGTPVNIQISDGSDTALVTTAGELSVQIGSVLPVTATGTLTAPSQTVAIDVGGYASVAIQLSGTWTATVGFDGTVDGTNWEDLQVVPSGSTTAVVTAAANGIWYVNVGGLNQIRAFSDAHSSGTVDVDLQANISSGKGVVASGAAGGTSETDDAAFTGGSTAVTPIGAIFDDTPPSITDGSVGAPRMNTDRVMLQDLFQVAGTATSVNAGNVDAGTQRVVLPTDQASLTVDAPTGTPVNVQIGDGTDQAAVTGSNELSVLATAQPGVDIGDVTINNAAAGAAVNIQDGGNSITVDAPTGTPVNVQIGDGTDQATVTTAGELSVQIGSVLPVTATGTLTAPSQTVSIDVGGYASVAIQLSGTWTATVGFDGTVDGTNWEDLQVVPSGTTTAVTTAAANGIWYVNVGGLNEIRAFSDAHSSGTVDVDLQSSISSGKGVVASGAAGGTSETDDTAFTGASTAVTPIGAIFDDTPPSITDGNVGAPRMNTNRVMLQDLFQIAGTATTVNAGNVDAGTQRVVLASDQAVVSIDDNSGSLTVDTVADATDAAAHGASQTGFRVMGTDGTNDQQVSVNATGHVNIADGGNSITVDAPTGTPVAVEIGDGTDTVLVTAAGEMNVIATAQAGVDIGDVTVNNGAGGAAVNIQDGGNSLTVDAPAGTPVNVQIGDATNQATVTAAGELDVIQPASHTRNEAFAQSLAIGGELDDAATTAATEGNVSPARITAQRGLHVNLRDDAGVELGTTAAPVGIQIGDGTDTATVTAGGELNVIATAQPSVDIGDVTINNAAAGAAVNIQDGGNSITVDAPVGTPANVQIGDGSDTALVTAAGELNVIATAQPGVDIGDVDIGSVIPVTATGTLTAPSQSVTIDVGGYGSVAIQLSGTWTATVGFDGTVDGTNWVDLQVVPTASTTAVLTSAANGIWYVNVGGLNQIRAFADAHSSGTVDVDLQANIASGKSVVAAGAAGGTSETDDAAFTGGSTAVTPMGAIFDATPPTITDGSVGAPRMNTDRVMLQDLFQVGGVATSVDAGNTDTGTQRVVVASDQASLTVDAPTGTPVNVQIGDGTDQAAVTGSNELSVLATAQPGVDIGDVTVNNATGNPASVEIGDGTDTVLVTAAGEMNVLATAQAGVDIGDVTVNNTAGASAVFVQGQAAHDAAVAGNPVVMGGRSNANEPTAVSADDEAVWAWMDRFGRQVTVAGHPSPEAPNTTNVTASGNTELIATPGGGLSLYIKKGSVHNTDSATIVVQLKDGSAGTVRWQAELASNGGGSLFDFGDVGWKLTANTALNGNLAGTSDVNFNITEYYISA